MLYAIIETKSGRVVKNGEQMSEIETTGVYSNKQILESIESGHIVQHPYAPELINASSVDVRLGHHFYRTDIQGIENGDNIYNPYDKEDVDRYFGESLEAQPLRDLGTLRNLLGGQALKNIDPEQPIILMRPHERILAHTHEFIGIRAPGTSSMQAKSTTGRNGIVVCKDAGWGDPGYIGRWTMEIQNDNDEYVPLQVGMRIAQIVFYHTGEVSGNYTSLSGNYQSSDNLDELIKTWEPEAMLPKSYKMKVQTPPTIEGLSQGLK